MTPTIVTVIDSNSLRAGAMAQAFSGLNCNVIVIWKEPDEESEGFVLKYSHGDERPSDCAIRLWHMRDLFEECQPIRSTLTIYYGGNGGWDSDRPSDGGEVIWRPISSANGGVLTKPEAEALLRFAAAKGEKPDFLCPPTEFVVIGSLALLCQGFLAVQAAHGRCDSGEATSALKRMGWTPECSKLLDRPGQLIEVQDRSWWLKAFNLNVSDEPEGARWHVFLDQLRREWGASNNLQIVEHFSSKIAHSEDLSVEVVAGAYIAIADRLRSDVGGRV